MRGERAVLLSGLLFGVSHLANASVARFERSYVLIQVCLAALIGSFLSSRMLLRGHATGLLEPLVLHVANNILAAPLPVSRAVELSDPFVCLSFAWVLPSTLLCRPAPSGDQLTNLRPVRRRPAFFSPYLPATCASCAPVMGMEREGRAKLLRHASGGSISDNRVRSPLPPCGKIHPFVISLLCLH